MKFPSVGCTSSSAKTSWEASFTDYADACDDTSGANSNTQFSCNLALVASSSTKLYLNGLTVAENQDLGMYSNVIIFLQMRERLLYRVF